MAARKKRARKRAAPRKKGIDAVAIATQHLEGDVAPKPFHEHPDVAAIVLATLQLVDEDAKKASRSRKPRRYADSSPTALLRAIKEDVSLNYSYAITKFRNDSELLCPELYKKYWRKQR